MKYLERLLEGSRVEWKRLGEVANLKRGETITAKNKTDGNIPVIGGGQKPAYYTAEYNREGETITIAGSGTAGYVSYWNEPIFVSDAFSVKPNLSTLSTKYVFYFLSKHQNWIYNLKRVAGVPHVYPKDLANFLIPIPPLRVQEEIVRILDTFTRLIAELTAELTARKKQYNYYLYQLFSFEEENVDWRPLGDIGDFQRGKRFVKNDIVLKGIPCIHYGEMYTHYGIWADESKSFLNEDLVKSKKLRVAEKGDIIIVAGGETIEDIGMGTAWLGDEGIVIHDACFSYRSSLNPKYVAYFTRTKHFHDQIRKHISSGKISAINAKGLSKAIIPIPSLEEQKRIITILDKFNTLTTSISEGLPREIELRKKQYAYYRELLLTFPEGTNK